MKKCPYCGCDQEDKNKICTSCNKKFDINDKTFKERVIEFSKGTSKLHELVFGIAVLIGVLVVVFPLSYLLFYDDKFKTVSLKSVCRKNCGMFKYTEYENIDMCACDDGRIINEASALQYDRNNLPEVKGSMLENNVDKLLSDYNEGKSFILFTESYSNCGSSCIIQLRSVLYRYAEQDFLFHYVDYDKLNEADKIKVLEIMNGLGDEHTNEINVTVIVNKNIMFYSNDLHRSLDIMQLCYEYGLFE